jgi:protein arginine kinase activator
MKKCDLCGENPATIQVRQMDKAGQVTEIEVCEACAAKRGFSDSETIQNDVAKILAEMKDKVAEEDARLICSTCGLSFAEFKRKGRLGCPACYESFGEKLEALVRRLHGAVQHVGRGTRGGVKQAQVKMNAERLRRELDHAIKSEDYERAARLRDELNKAENVTSD